MVDVGLAIGEQYMGAASRRTLSSLLSSSRFIGIWKTIHCDSPQHYTPNRVEPSNDPREVLYSPVHTLSETDIIRQGLRTY